MIKRLICIFIGHDWKAIRTPVGKLDTGVEIYQQKFGDCQRCGKEIK